MDPNPLQPSEIRRQLAHNLPGIECIPWCSAKLVNEVYRRTRGSIEFASSNSSLYTPDGRHVGFYDVLPQYRITPDPKLHVQQAIPAVGRYTQNSQFHEKDPIWKTRNEISYRCFVTGCEFTFDLLFTPTGKSGAIMLFETLTPNFKKNAYGDAFDKRGLTRDIEVLLERINEVVQFAHSKR